MRIQTAAPSTGGREAKGGTPIGVLVPEGFRDAIESWGPQYRTKTERVEALLEIGLKIAPRYDKPLAATYAGHKVRVNANPPPEISRRAMAPVRRKKTSITHRVMTLLHAAMVAEEVELALQADWRHDSSSRTLEKTGTG